MVDFEEAADLKKAQTFFSRRLFRAGFTEDLAVELALERWVECTYVDGFLTTGVGGTKERIEGSHRKSESE